MAQISENCAHPASGGKVLRGGPAGGLPTVVGVVGVVGVVRVVPALR
jgi:hypothetical protein